MKRNEIICYNHKNGKTEEDRYQKKIEKDKLKTI